MTYIEYPENDNSTLDLPFYLATEEFVARRLKQYDDCFFMWQVEPTVIFGRNQLIEAEVNLDYCRQNGVQAYRRKSGGGCVYADMGNVMLSFITRDENVSLTFNRYINLLVLTLYKMGIEAKATGRNDVLIDGRKVSGNAFYHVPGRSIVHGTLLYDTNMRHMVGSITPSDEKLVSKGVKSVRQHIALLKDFTTLPLDEVKAHIRRTLCKEETHRLTHDDMMEIAQIRETYLTPEFIYGNNPRYTTERRQRIEGAGEFRVSMEVKNNTLVDIDIKGDFFLTGDLDEMVTKPLRGCPMTEEALMERLPDNLGDVVMNLKKEDFVKIILNN